MVAQTYVSAKAGGAWRQAQPKAKAGGVWRNVVAGWVKVAGVWQQFYTAAVATVFTPDGGTVDNGQRIETLTCTTPAVWTWSVTGPGLTNRANGATALDIQLRVNVATAGNINQAEFTVTGVGNGVTRNFLVNVVSDNR